MARPEKFEDLMSWEQRSQEVCRLCFDTKLPGDVLVAMSALAKTLKDNGFTVDDDSFYFPLSNEDKQKKLEENQKSWDASMSNYQKVMARENDHNYEVSMARAFAEREGLELPEEVK